jgi:putative copper export protein
MAPADILSVAVRALAFVALLQAAGAVLFLAVFGGRLRRSRAAIVLLARRAALIAVPAVATHLALEAARMSGTLAGVLDLALQRLAWHTSGAAAHAMQMLGLLLIALAAGRARAGGIAAVVGATIAIGGFLLTGHTSTHPWRAVLAPLLALHLLIVAFWFGALLPLRGVLRRETPAAAVELLREFSLLAARLVPLIAVVGAALAWILAGGWPTPRQPYGALLLVKLAAFSVLMVLAAANRWRWTPLLAAAQPSAGAALTRSIVAEFALLCGVLAVTAALTTFYSPEP